MTQASLTVANGGSDKSAEVPPEIDLSAPMGHKKTPFPQQDAASQQNAADDKTPARSHYATFQELIQKAQEQNLDGTLLTRRKRNAMLRSISSSSTKGVKVPPKIPQPPSDAAAESSSAKIPQPPGAAPSESSSAKSDPLYEVQAVVGKRHNTTKNRIEYLIKWKGWEDKHNTWEPLHHLNCDALIDRYEAKRGAPESIQGANDAEFNPLIFQVPQQPLWLVEYGSNTTKIYCWVTVRRGKDEKDEPKLCCKVHHPYVASMLHSLHYTF